MSALRTRGIKDSRRRASPPVLTRRGIVRSAEKDARRRVSGDDVKEKIFLEKSACAPVLQQKALARGQVNAPRGVSGADALRARRRNMS